MYCVRISDRFTPFIIEKPSAKFGEALRDQVEERLKFFETGEPPSKNAEAIRKVLVAIALEDEEGSDEEEEEEERMKVDDSPRKDAAGFSILPLIENSPPVESPKKKSKKRKGDDIDVDREEEAEEAPRKKVKLSKEEKKALKKELKQKRKEKTASVCPFSFSPPPVLTYSCSLQESPKKEKEEKEEKKEKKEKKGKTEKVVDGTTTEKPERKKKRNKESSS